MSDLLCVAPNRVDEVWPLVAAWIDRAYAEMDEITPDVKAWLLKQAGLLWVFVNDEGEIAAALTTSIVEKRDGLACRLVACGGRAQEMWQRHHPVIEEYAKAEGCGRLTCEGRLGWSRVLQGYKVKSMKLEKRIA